MNKVLSFKDIVETENPFIESLGPFIERDDWPKILTYNPLSEYRRKKFSEELQETLLSQITARFDPTTQALKIAGTIQRMIRTSYLNRNPYIIEHRRQKNDYLSYRGKILDDKLDLFPTYAQACIIQGCTGTGKTTIISKVLKAIPQIIEFGCDKRAGWIDQKQIAYLLVPMASYKGSFLDAIVSALATVLKSDQIRKTYRRWTIEKLAVEIGVLLVQYNVGLLIIEEMQPRDFLNDKSKIKVADILVRLLNFGIPIIFVGNPLAFEEMENHSQMLRRLCSEECFHLMPMAPGDFDWKEILIPSLWSYNVMPKKTPLTPEIEAALNSCSAGIPFFLMKAVQGAQRIAIDNGCKAVGLEHVLAYRNTSESYRPFCDFIDGFNQKDPLKLRKYLDVPWQKYGLMWGKIKPSDIVKPSLQEVVLEEIVGNQAMDEQDIECYRAVHEKYQKQYKVKKTKEAKRKEKNTKIREASSPDDLRSGNQSLLLEGVSQLMYADK